MSGDRFEALVVGAGPAGSVAALVLARGGARVALLDKARFPRDKACGDLVGPRGVRLLADLGLEIPGGRRIRDMVVIGPSGGRTPLPFLPGRTYADHVIAAPRLRFDAILHQAALAAGAESIVGRAAEPISDDAGLVGFTLSDGRRLRADVVIGADGATSRVAEAAGLVDPGRVLWGFAVSAYLEDPIPLPHIVLWEPRPWRLFPGYGWVFPGVEGRANLGLGAGLLRDRSASRVVKERFDDWVTHLLRLGVLRRCPPQRLQLRGGWLKMGILGTIPARGLTLLVGDATGLVNPLQGEGISQAMSSGRAAAEAVLAGPGTSAARYLAWVGASLARSYSTTAAAHAGMVRRPVIVSAVGRALTAPGLSGSLAGPWSIFWNDLLDGASASPARWGASAAARVGRLASLRGTTRRWFAEAFGT